MQATLLALTALCHFYKPTSSANHGRHAYRRPSRVPCLCGAPLLATSLYAGVLSGKPLGPDAAAPRSAELRQAAARHRRAGLHIR
jgi:hypothetical protein